MKKVFISHNSIDKPFVKKLATSLFNFGIDSWIDEAEIKYGESLIHKISDAIEELDVVLAIISTSSIDSSWVKKELSLAMTKEITIERIVVIPIVIEKCIIPFFLRDKLYADFTDKSLYKNNINKLIESMHWHIGNKKISNTENKLLGTNITKTYKSIYFQITVSVLLILFAITACIATMLFGRTDNTWSTYGDFAKRVYVFCSLAVAMELCEIIADLLRFSVIKIDPNFAEDLRELVIIGVFIKKYRKILKKYWKYPFLKLATFTEIMTYVCVPPMLILIANIALDVILKK